MKIKTQRIFKSNLIKGLLVLVFGMLGDISWGQTTVNYEQRTASFNTNFTAGTAASYNSGSYQIGQYANTSGAKQVVGWREFKTQGDNGGSSRSLKVGDEFKISVSAHTVYGQMGFALLSSPASKSSWDDRLNNAAISINLDNYGFWYAKYYNGTTINASTSSGSNNIGGSTSYKNFVFTCLLTAPNRMNITITDGTNTSYLYDLLLNNSNPITEYSLYLNDDWDGTWHYNIYWNTNSGAHSDYVKNTLTCPIGSSNVNFSISDIIPNGLAANSTSTVSVNSLTKSGSSTITLTAANTYTGTTTISAGTLKLNRTGGTTIPITNNVVVSAGTLQISTDQTLNNLTLSSGGLTIDDGVTLTINGTLTYSGGTMSYGSSTLGNLVISSSGQLIVSSGTFSTNGRVTLKSNSTGTASVGNSAGTISGNVTVERYIPALSSSGIRGRYRFLSSPLTNATLSDWQGETYITGSGTGFDATTSNAPSVYWYNEAAGGGINTRWAVATSTTGYDLVNGRGYRVFIRGDRTSSRLTGTIGSPSPDQNAITLNLTGTLKQGSVNFNSPTDLVTYTGSGYDAGWCLIGNPYASPIDWEASSGWAMSNVGSGIAVYNPQTNSYSYSLTSGVVSNVTLNGGSRYISSGQGFFIRTIGASPTLSCTESVKVTNTPAYIYKTTPSNQLRLRLTQDSSNIDETVIAFGEKFSDDFLETEDVNKLTNVTVNISSVVGIEQYAAINFTSINYKEKTIPLSVWGNANGNYQLDLTQVEGFDPTVTLFLKDKFLNTTTTIDQNKSINFSITDDSLSKGDFRFEILFKNNNTNVNEISSSIFKTNLNLFPNPASDILNINLSNANFKNSNIVVYNLSGMEVIKSIMNGASAQLNIETLGSGVYFVKVSNENGFSKTVIFVK